MNSSEKYFVELSRAAIFDDMPTKPPKDIDWQYIFDKSKEQNMAGLLFCAISRLDDKSKPSVELMQNWQQIMFSTIAIYSQRYNEFLRMVKSLYSNGIKLVGLKGCIIRNLYTVPELRTMGDFDLLADKKDISFISDIFESNGYKVKKDTFGIICDAPKGHWEIFYGLDEEFRENTPYWDRTIYNDASLDGYIYIPSHTHFLLHLIVHFGKHYIDTGAGLRNLCDIALYICKYKSLIDFTAVEAACKEQNYINIYIYVINSVIHCFGVEISNTAYVEYKNCEKFVEYTLLNGIWGKSGNSLFCQVAKDENENNKGIKRLLFPSAKILKNRYKYLRQFPFLLPIAWVHRGFSGVFKWKYSVKQMVSDMEEAFEFSDERIRWLKELGLQDKH